MSLTPAIQALYQGVILEHHAHPRGTGPLDGATHEVRHDNPLCGDRVTLRLRLEPRPRPAHSRGPAPAPDEGGSAARRIVAARFDGEGCALSIASASLLTTRLRDVSVSDALALLAALRLLVARGPEHEAADRALLGELVALEGTRQFPTRIRCALLPWEALARALADTP